MRSLPTRLAVLAAAAVLALALVACGDDDDTVVEDVPPIEDIEPEDVEEPEDVDEDTTVAVASTDLGDILVGADGMTIYQFDNDTQGADESACVGDCEELWPPVVVDGEPTGTDEVTAELGTITRDDGTTQLTVNGWPAYYFADDEAPGDVLGQAFAGIWWVFAPDGETIRDG